MLKNLIIIIFILIIAICGLNIYANERIKDLRDRIVFLEDEISIRLKNLEMALAHLRATTLSKPSYNAQGALLAFPDGSAYVPILFNDEVSLKKFQSKVGWQQSLEGQPFEGYYNFKEIFTLNEED